MSRIAIVGILLAVGIATWLLISGNPSTPPPDIVPDGASTPPVETGDPGTLDVRRAVSREMTEYELGSSARLLMIAKLRTTWTTTIEITLAALKNLEYRTWYMMSVDSSGPGQGYAGAGRGLPELNRLPTAEFLHDNDIQALVFDEVDPNAFPIAFWNVVGDRVRSGKMGLYFRPGFPLDDKNQALPAHPAMTHPVLGDLLPVKTALEIKGSPTPGVFTKKQLLKPTEAGYRHPASRLIPSEEESRKVWATAALGEGALGARFCYPVQELKSDAVVLINLEAGVEIPAVIASSGKARVLWMGNTDFGDKKTHFDRDKDSVQKTLLNHWWVWLVGQGVK